METTSGTKYPPHDESRSGAKVGWLYYKRHADAKAASAIAKSEAEYLARAGYDFGYCMPGTITKVTDGSKYAGLWEVCIP
jgi:hypothetical protein